MRHLSGLAEIEVGTDAALEESEGGVAVGLVRAEIAHQLARGHVDRLDPEHRPEQQHGARLVPAHLHRVPQRALVRHVRRHLAFKNRAHQQTKQK